jgi:hypothetical protein
MAAAPQKDVDGRVKPAMTESDFQAVGQSLKMLAAF